jgi:putative acetyltransferase
MNIVVDDLSGPQIAEFLAQHVQEMPIHHTPESKHRP